MGTPVIRSNDMTPLGGTVVSVRTVFAEGKPITAMGDAVTPHPHGNVTMAGTVLAMSVTVFAGGMQVARMGDTVSPPCVEPIIATSTSVFVA